MRCRQSEKNPIQMVRSEIVNPNITLYLLGFRAYKSPAHSMWTTVRFTEKLSLSLQTVTTKVIQYQVVRHHYSKSLKGSSCNLNRFDTAVQGSMELNNHQFLKPLVLLAACTRSSSSTKLLAVSEGLNQAQHKRRMLRRILS